jgi:hypothetical protein
MHQGKDLTAGVLCAARRLLKSGVRIEEQLARTLNKCDKISAQVCAAVSVTLTKLVQDIAGTPLVLSEYVTCPNAMRCILTVLNYVLVKVRPDELKTRQEVRAAEAAARALCEAHNLPEEVCEMAAVLVAEIAATFQKLDVVLQPPYVKKCRNARILRDRVAHFLREVQADIFVVAFASLKLAVCMRALADGCFEIRKGDKRLLEGLLHQVKAKARTVAALNQVHRDNIHTATLMAARRPRA